jgi:AcrR family transcriptional regulator
VHNQSLSRREQNKADAYLAIHRAAYRLVVENECNAPVEEIAAEAGVSQRTFFNYFKSKEEAVVGLRAPQITRAQHDELRENGGHNLFDRVVSLYFHVVRDTVIDPDSFRSRVAVFRERPEHKIFLHRHMAACESAVNDAVAEVLADLNLDVAGLGSPEASARAIATFAGSVVRYTFSTHPDALSDDGELRFREALDVFRRLMKETQ